MTLYQVPSVAMISAVRGHGLVSYAIKILSGSLDSLSVFPLRTTYKNIPNKEIFHSPNGCP